MGVFENIPYTNFHELNLDWFVNTFRNLLDEWAVQKTEFTDLKTAWTEMQDFVNSYFDDLNVQNEINNKLEAMLRSGELESILQLIFNDFEADYNDRLSALESRMDGFTNLPEGSTTGDAELQDIRIGADGTVYPTAGDAVRGQYTKLSNYIDGVTKTDETITYAVNTGIYCNINNGNFSSNQYFATAKDSADKIRIAVPDGCKAIAFDVNINPASGAGWATYTTDQGSSSAAFIRGGKSGYIILANNEKFFGVCSYIDPVTELLPAYINVTFIYDIDKYLNKKGVQVVEEIRNYATTINRYINYTNGNVQTISNNSYAVVRMIQIPYGVKKITLPDFVYPGSGVSGWAVYDDHNTYIRGGYTPYIDIVSGDALFCFSTYGTPPAANVNVEYWYTENGVLSEKYRSIDDAAALAQNGKKIVMLGDSIVGNYDGPGSIPYYVAEMTKANVYNCAFGGSSMGSDTTSPDPYLEPFNGWKIIQAITTGDYSDMQDVIDNDPTYQHIRDNFQTHLDTLENMDWTTVDMITLSYGTNDWGTGVVLDDPENPYNTDTFTGAIRTALQTLWSVYPNIKVMMFGVIWRGITISGGVVIGDSDDGRHGRQWYLKEYEDAAKDTCQEYHVPFVPMYDFTCFNRYTWSAYFPATDGTHPTASGRYVMSRRYAAHMLEI